MTSTIGPVPEASKLHQASARARRLLLPPAKRRTLPLPPNAQLDLEATTLDYCRARLEQHILDSYCGAAIQKMPEDLRVYEHLLWQSSANVVIELGTNQGGSTLWFRDRLVTMAHYGRIRRPRVIAVDIIAEQTAQCVRAVDPDAAHISFLQADVCDPSLPERVAALMRPSDRAFVIEDSAHVYDTTMAALVGFAAFVRADGYFVVEDTCIDVDALRVDPLWPRGVLPAVHDWLVTAHGADFVSDRTLELYGVTCHPEGFLRRRRPDERDVTPPTT